MKEGVSKEIYRKRPGEIEAVFGQITYNRNFRRFNLRGLESVRGDFLIVALSHNLGKIMKKLKTDDKNDLISSPGGENSI